MKRFNTKNNPTRQHKAIKKTINQTSHLVKRGQFGLRSLEYKQVDIKQINSIKMKILKEIKVLEKNTSLGKIKIWFYMRPKQAVTKLSPETRMGKGKGPIVSHCCYIRPGQLIFELSNLSKLKASELISSVQDSFSFKTQLLFKFY
uniref:Ribosomal protein L16 n=1 Tax=Pyropia kanakaensis TaxID=139729 RepID=A0A060DDK9_9RHOD|nr:ribosomal protein L16 [Pyropia kanakaensis]AIB08159.1 ribosomal protein L16 [Pyropia kanakaensis]AIB08217.1 ribosomal protein L16 [Pyropia kanakaensis]